MLDARGQQEKEKNPRPERAERKAHQGGKGRPLGRSENREPKPDPETQKRTEETPKSRGKHPSGKFLEERERVGVAIAERDRGHVPQGDYQTSVEVWQSPAPESVVETQKVTAKATHTKILLLSCRSRRPKSRCDDATLPPGKTTRDRDRTKPSILWGP